MSAQALAVLARRLNHEAGAPAIPSLFFLSDPERTPNLISAVRRLPAETAVIYRHFGASERVRMARELARICRARRLCLLISTDPDLAERVGAAGVHWPERWLPKARAHRLPLTTASAHSREAVAHAAQCGFDACLLAPIFDTRSASGNAPLGLFRASQIARSAAIPVVGLGGVNVRNAARLSGRGFAGIAAIDALLA